MIKDKEIQKLDNSAVRLTITIDQHDAQKMYDELLARLQKDAQIPGFRKGKVPTYILEKKFGEGLRYETAERLIQEGLREAFDQIEEKPLSYSVPSLTSDFPTDFSKDVTFTVEYDVYPEFTLPDYSDITVEEPKVTISKEDIARELEKLRKQNSYVVEKQDGEVKEGDIVTVDYWELDGEGNPVEESRREDYVFTVGTRYNLYEFDDDLIGAKKGEVRTITKEFPEDYRFEEFRGKTITVQVEIKAIKEQRLPDLDDEFAQDIDEAYQTLDDLKKAIEERLMEQAKAVIRQKKIDQFLTELAKRTEIPIPASMLKAEMDASYQQLAQQYRTTVEALDKVLEQDGKTREQIYEEWKPSATEALKKRLIITRLIEERKIEVSDDELETFFKEVAEGAGASADQVKAYYAQMGQLEQIRYDLKERKLFDQLLEEIKVKKGPKVPFVDLVGANE
ncbi:trigger factor [Spirochaeta thermophila]|uniref:Trigger factor n=1 Tax=Winmispira thermophila (strain ATCC 49972 / DSM 6192 / RI 19.B1) TaxID=665571 RepID=E0RQP5_WINT6|nr:trigger factor [Spirochaeta thermophila]ADN01549.1 trigger factor [Spirochaeta thermophila DSM 6192]